MSSLSTSRKRSSYDTPDNVDTKIVSAASSSSTLLCTPTTTITTPTSSSSGSKTKLRVRIKQFHGVAKWTWNVGGGDNNDNNADNNDDGDEDDVCGICQSAFEGCPPGVKFPGDESPVVFGLCGKLSFYYLLQDLFISLSLFLEFKMENSWDVRRIFHPSLFLSLHLCVSDEKWEYIPPFSLAAVLHARRNFFSYRDLTPFFNFNSYL
jgi:hypothetical protein